MPQPTPAESSTLTGLPQSGEGTHAACQFTLLSPRAIVSWKPEKQHSMAKGPGATDTHAPPVAYIPVHGRRLHRGLVGLTLSPSLEEAPWTRAASTKLSGVGLPAPPVPEPPALHGLPCLRF